jgi:hypothetical protein
MSINNDFYKLALFSFFVFSIFTFTKITFAQEAVNAPTIDSPQGPGTTMSDQTNNVTGTTDDMQFNNAWLLPLIAIPILLYLVWPKNRQADSMDLSRTNYAGVKGGKSSRKSNQEDEDDDLF